MDIRKIAIFFSMLIFVSTLSAQNFKKVMGRPVAFAAPINNPTYYLSSTKDKESSIPWVVICDRSNPDRTKTYAEASESSHSVKTLKFKDWFYVLEEKGDWIRIGKATMKSGTKIAGNVKDFGWIKKENMMLWTTGLLDSKTLIHQKAFLLNKKSDIKKILGQKKKEIVKILKGPYTGETIGEKTIYEFYFILKSENDRYLLAKQARLSPNLSTDWESNLLGWVESRRVTEWDTRICLEPNFGRKPYEERKGSDNLKLRAFSKETAANTHASSGAVDAAAVEWNNDPVGIERGRLSKSDERRFGGGVVRFPMLGNNNSNFRTGVIGEIKVKTLGSELEKIDEINYSGIIQNVKESGVSADNYDVFFLIEATPAMASYQSAIINSIKQAKLEFSNIPNVRFGAAIYRDALEKGKVYDVKSFTSNIDDIASYISSVEFRRWLDNENYTALHYGLQQGLLEAGFKDNHTNIIYIIGSYGDYSRKATRRRKAKLDNDPTLIDDISGLVKTVGDLNAHLVAIQCRNDDGNRSLSFTDQCQNLILESAKNQYFQYKGASQYIPDLTLLDENNIKIEFSSEDNRYTLKGGAVKGFIYQPKDGGVFSPEDVSKSVVQAGSAIKQFNSDFWREMNRVVEDGAPIDNISSGALAPAAAKELFKLLKKGKKGWNENDIKKLSKEKYRLYTEVYIPKQIQSAKYPTYSYVLFMPDEDLDRYTNRIEQIAYAVNGATPAELRQEIYFMFLDLLEYYTGNTNEKKNAKMSTEDVRRVMQGLESEGFTDLGKSTDFVIKDIMSKKKMPDEKVRIFTDQILENARKLKKVQKRGKDYEFSYTSGGNTYFWIPIDWTF